MQDRSPQSDRWNVAALPYVSLLPLLRRFQLGEGALLAVNLAVIWRRRPGIRDGVLESVLSFCVLAVMYAFNDLWDAGHDLKNPKKDQRLAATLAALPAGFYAALAAEKAAIALLGYALGGAPVAGAVLAAFLINAVYSARLKATPGLDVLCVVAWGAAYAAVVQAPWRFCLLVGLLTAVCHVFQMREDRDVDRLNGVTTSAVFSSRLTSILLLATCAAACLLLLEGWGGAASLSALIPLGLGVFLSDERAAWTLTRVYCAVVLWGMMGIGRAV